jgi:hypothetical protein
MLNNANGFQTNVWGPVAWMFLHCVSLNYSPERKKDYKRFFHSLAGVLPCGSCRNNYMSTITRHQTLKLTNKVFDSRESMAYWLFRLHNYVRKCQTNKKPFYKNTKTDFKKMVSNYERFRAKCPKDKNLPANQIHSKHGCTTPLHGGIRLRSVITVIPLKQRCRSRSLK